VLLVRVRLEHLESGQISTERDVRVSKLTSLPWKGSSARTPASP
jgi:hypothetical protein